MLIKKNNKPVQKKKEKGEKAADCKTKKEVPLNCAVAAQSWSPLVSQQQWCKLVYAKLVSWWQCSLQVSWPLHLFVWLGVLMSSPPSCVLTLQLPSQCKQWKKIKSTIKAMREKQKEENNNQSLYSHHPVCCSKHKPNNQHVRPRGETSCLANERIETEAKNRDAIVLLLKKQQSYDEQCSLSMSTIPASSSSSYQTLLKPRHPWPRP